MKLTYAPASVAGAGHHARRGPARGLRRPPRDRGAALPRAHHRGQALAQRRNHPLAAFRPEHRPPSPPAPATSSAPASTALRTACGAGAQTRPA